VVTNHGPSTATGIVLTNTLPAGAAYISSSTGQGTISANGGLVVWSIGTLAKDAAASATIVARPAAVGMAVGTSTALATEADPNPGNNTAITTTTVAGVNADLVLGMTAAPNPVFLGGELIYSLVITNLGPATATGVTLTNTLPSGVSFVSATPPGYTVVGNVVGFTNLGDLGSGSTLGAAITVRLNGGGTLTSTARCSSSVNDPLKGNNTVTVKTVVALEAPQLDVAISNRNLRISWPVHPSGIIAYQLESTTNLSPPVVWTPVTNLVLTVENGQYVVTLPIGSDDEFFRLRAMVAGFPQLSLSRVGNDLVIVWSAYATGYVLERAPNLPPPITWTTVTVPAPVAVGDQKRVTLPIGSGNEFFRLKAQSP
jgi:uncharacterized repeat protein (TIGR01451 family)